MATIKGPSFVNVNDTGLYKRYGQESCIMQGFLRSHNLTGSLPRDELWKCTRVLLPLTGIHGVYSQVTYEIACHLSICP